MSSGAKLLALGSTTRIPPIPSQTYEYSSLVDRAREVLRRKQVALRIRLTCAQRFVQPIPQVRYYSARGGKRAWRRARKRLDL